MGQRLSIVPSVRFLEKGVLESSAGHSSPFISSLRAPLLLQYIPVSRKSAPARQPNT